MADLTGFDAAVLAHITRYPGLSSYEITRALGLTYTGRAVNKSRIEQSLLRLVLARAVTCESVPWPGPGGRKRTWHPLNERNEPNADAND